MDKNLWGIPKDPVGLNRVKEKVTGYFKIVQSTEKRKQYSTWEMSRKAEPEAHTYVHASLVSFDLKRLSLNCLIYAHCT